MDITSKIHALIQSLSSIIYKGIHFAYTLFIKPRSHGEESRRRELILNSVLTGFLTLLGLLNITVLYNTLHLKEKYIGVPFLFLTLCFLLIASLLFLSRKGLYRLSSFILISICFLSTVYGSYTWGMSMPAGLLSYAFIILMSSVLIDKKFGLAISFLIATLLIILAHFEELNHIIPSWHGKPTQIVDAFQYVAMLAFMTILAFIYSQDIERSLKRARASEQSLIEERDMLEIKVHERTAELRQAQAEKISQLSHFAEFGRLSSGLFHDLSGPLFTVALNIESLNTSLHPDLPEIKQHLKLSLLASQKMERFLTAARRQLQLSDIKEIFVINSIIEDVIMLHTYKAHKSGIIIDFKAKEKLSTYNNPLKFHQIVSNLIGNALDSFAPESLKITDREKERNRIIVKLSHKDNTATIEVSDNGSGISPDVIDKIYDPFFSTKLSIKGSGLGLGLSDAKLTIENDFHGSITVESNEKDGSKFTISFPLQNIDKDKNL